MLSARHMKDVSPQPVRWFIEPLVPQKGLTLLFGDPGVGKSLFTCALAQHARTLMLNCEDDVETVLVPRLKAAGAEDVFFGGNVFDQIKGESSFTLPRCTEELRRFIKQTGTQLVIIDPVFSFADAGLNPSSDADSRRLLVPLHQVSMDTNVPIICVGHLVKQNRKALYRVSGGIGVTGQARSVLLAVKDVHEKHVRWILQVKSNFREEAKPQKYQIQQVIDGTPYLSQRMYSEKDVTNEQVIDGDTRPEGKPEPKPDSELARAVAVIRSEIDVRNRRNQNLARIYSGWMEAVAKAIGVSKPTLMRAKKHLGIRSYRENGHWYWDVRGLFSEDG